MERKNLRRSASAANNDDLAVVKAAAWAWYQHGSGSQDMANMHEYVDVSRIRRAPIPSRYKLEAIKLAHGKEASSATDQEASSSSSSSHTTTTTTNYNSLLDTYEIERISKQLDILIEYNRSHRQKSSPESEEASNVILVEKKKKNKKKKKPEGFWFRHGLACGTTMAEVVIPTVSSDRRPRPEKRA